MTQRHHAIEQLNYDRRILEFMRWNCWAFIISGLLLILSIIVITIEGFNFGLSFTGGVVIEIALKKPVDIDEIRESLQQVGFKELLLQNLDTNRDIILRMPPMHNLIDNQDLSNKVIDVINKKNNQNAVVKRIEFVGPSVGIDLIQTGTIALLVALISTFIYLSFRFEWRLATGIAVALVHDVIITLGMLSLFHVEVDSTIVASLMSVIGYSLNDSIVVSDRIRENFRKTPHREPYEIFNVSLTQTLYRTLLTSGTTLMVILMLYLFGGPILKGFSLTMLIGISVGTASSIYIASTLSFKLGVRCEHFLQKKTKKEGTDQFI